MDDEGFGMCQKRDRKFDGAFSCYVNQPSSCIDVYTTPNMNAKELSAVACEDKNQGTIILYKNLFGYGKLYYI